MQGALKSWSNTRCLSFEDDKIEEYFWPRLPHRSFPHCWDQQHTRANFTAGANSTSGNLFKRRLSLLPRADCRSIQVVAGDSCASLATRCNIPGPDITKYNTAPNFCATLQPGQHICCSAGTLPDFTPKPNPDGSCATATVNADDTCFGIASANGLTVDQLNDFNKNTWAWNGCASLWVGTIICLSTGTPPMPAPIANTVCGPQVPGTVKPAAGVDIASLNPCPLNACCDVWG